MSRYVYVIGVLDGPFKIGIATDPKARLISLQIGNHDKLSVLHAAPVARHNAVAVERFAHKMLRSRQLSGEWFSGSLADTKAAVDYAAATIAAQSASKPAPEPAPKLWPLYRPDVDLVHRVTLDEHIAMNDEVQRRRQERSKAAPPAPAPPTAATQAASIDNLTKLADVVAKAASLPKEAASGLMTAVRWELKRLRS